jgi:hypothetical protein
MRAIGILGLLSMVAATATPASADERPFTGSFSGTGRACSGGLHVRTKTIEWNSSFSVCKPTRYEVLDKDSREHERIAFRLKTRSKRCLYEVVQIEHVDGANWNAAGYQSLEAYQNREAPDWKNSPLPERQVLSCPMIGPN